MILTNSPMVRFDVLQRGEQFVAAHCGSKLHHGVQEIRRTVSHAPRGRAVKRRNTGHLCAKQRVNLPNGGSQGGFHLAHIAPQGHHRVMDGMLFSSASIIGGTHARDGDRYICKSHDDGRVRLVHGDVDGGDGRRIGKNLIRDTLGQTLDQVHMRAFDDSHDILGHAAVIDGVIEIVGLAGGGQIKVQGDVHDEGLWPFVFKGEHTVGAVGMYAGKCDGVHW